MDSQQQQFQPQPQPAEQDFDVWEFVSCAKCQLAFSPDGISGPSVPFWITECGHVICNNHLSACLQEKKQDKCVAKVELDLVDADQSCPSCNAQGIELMPLQKEVSTFTPGYGSRTFCRRCCPQDATSVLRFVLLATFQIRCTRASCKGYLDRWSILQLGFSLFF